MPRIIETSLLFCLILVAGCAAKPKAFSEFDPATDFSNFRSFSWISAEPLYVNSSSPVGPALEGILMQEVKAYLTSRGFAFRAEPEEADFVVALTLDSQAGIQTSNHPGRFGDVGIVGETLAPESDTQDYTEASLVIDIIDRASAQRKWMGWSQQELTMGDRLRQQSLARETVHLILKNFPPDA